jgi:hypothetical protein
MWLYLGPSDPDRSFSEQFNDTEINTQVLKVLDHGANLNPGTSLAPLDKRGCRHHGQFVWICFSSMRDFIFSLHL